MEEQHAEPAFSFWADPSLDELAKAQSAEPVLDISALLGDFWPDDEDLDDFLQALDDWRGHRRGNRAA